MEKYIKITEPGLMKQLEASYLMYYQRVTKEKLEQIFFAEYSKDN